MIITITGKPCSGKSTVSKLLVEKHGFKRIGVGDICKEEARKRGMNSEEFNHFLMSDPSFDFYIDKQSEVLGKQYEGQKVVFDSRLAWHFVPKSFKVFVDLNEDEMARRLTASDRTGKEKFDTMEEAKRTLADREATELERYKKIYNIDLSDLSNFDFVIDSMNRTPEQLCDEIWQAYLAFVEAQK